MAAELIPNENRMPALQVIGRNPVTRQLALLVGIAAAAALGVAAVMWSQSPNYRPLYTGLADKDSGQVIEALQKANIAYKIDPNSGAVLVPAGQLQDARIKLAAQGLPKSADGGFEILQEQPGFGTSQFLETARYQHALEGELARSIAALSNVQNARVHLALPKPSAFARDRQKASASVLVSLYSGHNLDEGQVAAIVHLVAASVPNLETGRVTIIDQKGRLLTAAAGSPETLLSDSQFDYRRKLEESYIRRIEEIVSPLVGVGGVRAQVMAAVDFTVTEQTQEKFNPAPALRSEQIAQEETLAGAGGAAGIPGALSNQPPGAASAPEITAAKTKGATAPLAASVDTVAAQIPRSNSSRATRNYELDKTISHTRLASGEVKRLSIAVVVDDRQQTNEDGEVVRTPFKPDELERITGLVKEAVGFNAQRGDSVSVINASFTVPAAAEPLPEPPFWKQSWLWDVAKQVLAGVAVLFLIFGVLRPIARGLLASRPAAGTISADQLGQLPMITGMNYDTQLSTAKTLTAQDPKRAAQVVKNWVASDA